MVSTMMKTTLKALALVAITVAIALIALSSISINYKQRDNDISLLLPSKRINRFIVDSEYNHHNGRRSLKPADHCHKDNEACDNMYGKNFTCCGNKCFDFTIDKKNCGACHNKCKFTYDCCDGMCVDKTYDKRHCGGCNNKCSDGQLCVYGMCDYA